MTIKKQTSQIETEIKTQILGITLQDVVSKSGNHNDIIILETTSGNYSAYKSVWDATGINANDIQPGQPVTIAYVDWQSGNGRVFKNFKRVSVDTQG